MSFLILASTFLFIGRSILGDERREDALETARELAHTAEAYSEYREQSAVAGVYDGWRSMELRILLSSASSTSDYHIFLCDAGGEVISCSDRPDECAHIGRQLTSLSPQDAQLLDEQGTITDLAGFYAGERFVVAAPVYLHDQNQAAGYIFVSTEPAAYAGAWASFRQMFFLTAVVVLLLAVLMSFVASRRMAKPLSDMVAASSRFAHGDFSARVELADRDDEIGELTEAFNAMAESLEKSEVQRREFIANVSHELKTPMTTIAGFADGILDGTIPRENQDKYLQTISSETKRLSRLVRRMLDLSRFQESAMEELLRRDFDLRELLTRTLLSFEDKIYQKTLDADVLIPEESILVRGDEDAIQQVVYNLLDNAIKFAKPESMLGISLWKKGDKACVSIKNQGETIDSAELNRIFDRFHKTDRSRSLDRDGVGLGLYIVKAIVNNHGEDIYVTSREGVTEFVFTLALKEKTKS